MSGETRVPYVLYVEWWDGSREVVGTFPSPEEARLWQGYARQGIRKARVLQYRELQRVPDTNQREDTT